MIKTMNCVKETLFVSSVNAVCEVLISQCKQKNENGNDCLNSLFSICKYCSKIGLVGMIMREKKVL